MFKERVRRWYFGGIASVGAVCATHPLDLLKVTMQCQRRQISVGKLASMIIREQGVLALYNGLTASIMRQMTYATARFGAYELGKDHVDTNTFGGKVSLAAAAGLIGGSLGTPADIVNVRMQYDVRMPPEKRRNYKHAIDGIIQIYRHEGFSSLFTSAPIAVVRGVAMTIGQVAVYDHIKMHLIASRYFEDNLITHFAAALMAGFVATTLSQPMDVIKTRQMNAKPGRYTDVWDVIRKTGRKGPQGYFKGYGLSFLRLGPQTILTFVCMEQLRLRFGYEKITTSKVWYSNI